MHYVALGDSISIDKYTGRAGGGAASQLADFLRTESFQNLTVDGNTTQGVLAQLDRIGGKPDVITLTVGGNDLLQAMLLYLATRVGPNTENTVEPIVRNIDEILRRLSVFGCPVIVNTVYDPTDGNDAHAVQLGIPPEGRALFNAVNAGIRKLAERYGHPLCDIERLFHGHGFWSSVPWITSYIEPNLAGATALAECWYDLCLDHLRLRESSARL
jgi:lysophospholipase L1-like esterase